MLTGPSTGQQQRQRHHRRQNSTPIGFEIPKVAPLPPSPRKGHRRHQSFDQQALHRPHHRRNGSSGVDGLGIDSSGYWGESPQHHQQQQQQPMPPQSYQMPPRRLVRTYPRIDPTKSFIPRSNEPQSAGGYTPVHEYSDPFTSAPEHSPMAAGMMVNIPDHMGFLDPNLLASPHSAIGYNTMSGGNYGYPSPLYASPFDEHTMMLLANHQMAAMNGVSDDILLDQLPTTPHRQTTLRIPQTEPARRKREMASPLKRKAGNMSIRDQFQQDGMGTPTRIAAPEMAPISVKAVSAVRPGLLVKESTDPFVDDLPESPTTQIASHRLSANNSLSPPPMMRNLGQMQAQMQTGPPMFSNEVSEDVFDDALGHSTAPSSPIKSQSVSETNLLSLDEAQEEDFDLEGAILETGITMDDIHQYIEGPDPQDNKWICTFKDCYKRFGRKENIKSHVQTHLDDRQFLCKVCNKRFVRQHDLKRHAKIHSGSKPYKCPCGNGFARQDALTRHRQRGMCSGGFSGVVRKVVKRGRPKKTTTMDLNDRISQLSQMGQMSQIINSSSSFLGSDRSSLQTPPASQTMSSCSTPLEMSVADFAAEQDAHDLYSYTPPKSPNDELDFISPQLTQHSFSPALEQQQSHLQHTVLAAQEGDWVRSASASPRKRSPNSYETPELCDLSSSPLSPLLAPNDTRSNNFNKAAALAEAMHAHARGLTDIQEEDSEDFFNKSFDLNDTFGQHDLSTLEQHPSLLIGSAGQFDSIFDSNGQDDSGLLGSS